MPLEEGGGSGVLAQLLVLPLSLLRLSPSPSPSSRCCIFLLSFSLLQRSSGGSNYLLPNLTLPYLPYLSTPPSTYHLPLYLNKIASSLLFPSLPP